ncbi:MAG: hypothetical protein LBE22_10230 [Azoarcus sp.]|jgi:hypothetical protein|nr:hypothetical protein [Azoarcus sp.]
MLKGLFVVLLMFSCNTGVYAADAFSAVRCGSDVRKALLKRTIPNERVVIIEERHKDLGLKDLGGTRVSDDVSLITWRICGDEYVMLVNNSGFVRDVLKFPDHSKQSPQFIGFCSLRGENMEEEVIGVFERNGNGKGVGDMSPVQFAWRIDVKQAKLIKMETEELLCSRSGIITVDGGL